MSMVEFHNVTKNFGESMVLNGISLNIDAGEVVVVVGPSGSGKSTFLRCINVLETINGGDLLVDGLSVKGDSAQVREIRREAGMVFQQFNLFPQMTALENVMFGPVHTRGQDRGEARKLAEGLLDKVGLGERMHHYPAELSGGQQQRVAIARALCMKPRIMLFDEPTSALDPEMVAEVLDVLVQLAGTGMTMLCVTHEMGFARQVAERVLFLEGGQIIEDSPPQVFFNQPRTERAKAFLAQILH